MRTKISRLKTNISLLKEKLQHCREITHEKELKSVEQISIVQKPQIQLPLATN
ncbi:MAG: hypothetical protein M3Q44_05485 [bacterium]|nr:hypothetical protein [bacterium]